MSRIMKIAHNIKMAVCSLSWHRDKGTILFGAWFGEKFSDNSRFLFQYLSDNKNKYNLNHVVWVTRNTGLCNLLNSMGYEAYVMDSPESLKYHKTAKYHIVCNKPVDGDGYKGDILGDYSYGCIRINLWHGVAGMKGVGCSSNEYKEKKVNHPFRYGFKEVMLRYSRIFRLLFQDEGGWTQCYFLSTTSAETDILQQRVLIPRKYFIESSYPRNCKCPRLLKDEEHILSVMKQFKYVVLYLPTFRSGTSMFDENGVVSDLDSVLASNDILWLQKAHSADINKSQSFKKNRNMITLIPEFDINVIMPYITLLVTDYSSVNSDAMYHNKPVLYYVPDFAEYKEGSRGFAVEPDELMCGPKLYTPKELKETLATYVSKPDEAKSDNYYAVRSKYWKKKNSLEETWKDIIKQTSV